MIHKALLDRKKNDRLLLEEKLRTSKKTNTLSLTHFSLTQLPPEVLKQPRLVILDLSFNNLENLSVEIGSMTALKQLYLNNNPLQYLPIEISKCKALQTLKLSDTYIRFLPREMADLKALFELDLNNTPISGKLKMAYERGICDVFEYLQRKKDRSDYREMIVKKLKEWIYMSNSYEEIQQMMQAVMDTLKDASTSDLKRLFRNVQNIFPLKIQSVDPSDIRTKLFATTGIKKVKKAELFTVYE